MPQHHQGICLGSHSCTHTQRWKCMAACGLPIIHISTCAHTLHTDAYTAIANARQ